MKRSNLLALFMLLAVAKVHAFEYQISCADNKLTKFENISVNQNTDECKAFIANGFLQCFDSKKVNKSSEAITLSMPNDHYYQNKESNRYSRKAMQAIIDSAIKAGNDPYLALSIVVTENPPLLSAKKGPFNMSSSDMYADTYGNIPLDAIAVADTMGCDRMKTGYAGDSVMHLKNRGKLKQFVIDPKGVEQTVCIENRFMAGEGASFWLEKNPRPDDCCMKLKADSSGFVEHPMKGNGDEVISYMDQPLKHKVLDMMAQQYMMSRFTAAQKRAAGERLPQTKMAMVAQSYNGYGQFGGSEPMENRCLHKIHMGKTPVYGAGTSEIMLNSLMNNSEVQNMVSDSLNSQKMAHPVSYLCSSYGAGSHKVGGYTFTSLLGEYIGEKKTCPRYTNKLKGLGKFAQVSDVSSPSSPSSDVKKSNPAGIAN